MDSEKVSHNALEKTVFALGVIIVLVLFTYLSYEMFTTEKKPPHLEVITLHDPHVPGYSFKVKTTNLGEQTVANVDVNLDLYQAGKKVETASVNYDYVPVNSTEIAWSVFYLSKKKRRFAGGFFYYFFKPVEHEENIIFDPFGLNRHQL